MEKDKIFFGNEGLTSTSANYVANMAKEMCQTLQEELDNTSFVNGEIGLIGQQFSSTNKGVTSLSYMQTNLDTIVKAHSLIAWLREAIKAKENLMKENSRLSLKDWCALTNRDYPELPEEQSPITENDVLATWSVKDRNHYLELGAKVSTYGKFLHPDGRFSTARKELKKRLTEPVVYTESGRDTIIHRYSASISSNTVDNEFFRLQGEWRKAQAELNGFTHKIQLAIDEDTNQKNNSYSVACSDYQHQIAALNAEFKAYKDMTNQELSQLKIVIPNALKAIYETVVSLSK